MIFVIGGWKTAVRSSTEYLDLTNGAEWFQGPLLPRAVYYGSVVSTEQGEIYIIGGNPSDGSIIQYKDDAFITVPGVSLITPRYGQVAVELPNGFIFP